MRRSIKREAQAFFSAVEFLTRLPTPGWTGWEDGRLDRATPYFTLVGGLIGAACGLVYAVASLGLSPLLAALLAIATGIALTGGLHEDGLADFADGVGGGRDTAHTLAIMKDSQVGSYGVLALILVLAMKAVALATLPPAYGAAVLVAGHGLSRAYLFATVKTLAYARDEKDAKVAPISRGMVRGDWVRTVLFALLVSLPVLDIALRSDPERLLAIAIALIAAALATLAVIRLMRSALGGWTGDALGAQQQIVETAFLIGASAWISI